MAVAATLEGTMAKHCRTTAAMANKYFFMQLPVDFDLMIGSFSWGA